MDSWSEMEAEFAQSIFPLSRKLRCAIREILLQIVGAFKFAAQKGDPFHPSVQPFFWNKKWNVVSARIKTGRTRPVQLWLSVWFVATVHRVHLEAVCLTWRRQHSNSAIMGRIQQRSRLRRLNRLNTFPLLIHPWILSQILMMGSIQLNGSRQRLEHYRPYRKCEQVCVTFVTGDPFVKRINLVAIPSW